jgi:hypothetical protein
MGLAAAKIANKVRQALRKPKKKSTAQESMNYRKKLSREQNKRAKNEDLLPGETRPKSKVKKKADKVEQMSDARLKREKQLANPYLTYEDRAKLLGGFKEGGMLKKPRPENVKKRTPGGGRTLTEQEKFNIKMQRAKRMRDAYRPSGPKKYKEGGSVKGKCRMDGIAIRGKTRAKERSK